MRELLVPVLSVTALVVIAVGCGEARKGDLPEERFQQNPKLSGGRVAFMQHCNQCHVQGGPALGPGIIDKPLPASAIKTQVRLGAGTMPSFGKEKISDEELDAMVAYLIVLRDEGKPLSMR